MADPHDADPGISQKEGRLMPAIRKTVRDAMVSILAAAATGFNSRFATVAAAYGIDAFELDWEDCSRSVFHGQVPSQVDQSQLSPEEWAPLGLMIYTTTVEGQGREKPRAFSGDCEIVLDFDLVVREGVEEDDIETVGDAIEDAVLDALFDAAAAWPPACVLSQNFVSLKQAAELTGDGWRQRILMNFRVGVSL